MKLELDTKCTDMSTSVTTDKKREIEDVAEKNSAFTKLEPQLDQGANQLLANLNKKLQVMVESLVTYIWQHFLFSTGDIFINCS